MVKIRFIFLSIILLLALVTSVNAGTTFHDKFERANSTTVGGAWTETIAGFNITNNNLNATSSARGRVTAANVSHSFICFQYNNTASFADGVLHGWETGKSKTLYGYWENDTQYVYFDGTSYVNCGDDYIIQKNDWFCYGNNTPYKVQIGQNSSNMINLCNISTTYNRADADFTITIDSGVNSVNVNVAIDEVCASSSLADCTDQDENQTFSDTSAPSFSHNGTNSSSVKIDGNLQFFINVTDETELGYYIFSFNNGSGTFKNDTLIDLGTNTTFNATVTKTINSSNGTSIQWKWFANDSSSNLNSSETYSLVVSNTVPTISITSPINNSVVSNNFTNFSATYSDADGNTGNCTLYINETKYGSNATINTGQTFTLQNNIGLVEGTHRWYFNCSDTGSIVQSTPQLRYVDLTQPTITWTFPQSDNSSYNNNGTLKFNVVITDNNLIDSTLINLTLKSNNTQYYSNLTRNILTTSSTFDAILNFSTFPEGVYKHETSVNDTAANSPKIPHYNSIVKTDYIDFDESKEQNGKVDVSIRMTIEVLNPSSNNNSISLIGKNLILTANKDSSNEHILYGGTIENLAQGSSIRLTYSSPQGIREIKNSNHHSHFIVQNKFFHHNTLINKNWTIEKSGLNPDGTYFIIFYKDSYAKIEDFDPLTGEVNSNTEYKEFLYDVTAPNVTNLSYPSNGSYLSKSSIDFNFTVNDTVDLANCTLYHNGSGTFTANKTITKPTQNSELNITVSLSDATYLWNIQCSDNATNTDRFTDNYTVTIDTVNPNLTLVSPSNDTLTGNSWMLFNTTVNDTNLANVSLFINNTQNTTNSSQKNGTYLFNISGLSDGNHTWYIISYDLAKNNATSETRQFTVDTTNPVVTLVAPSNSSTDNDGNIEFVYNVTDSNNITNCSLYINNILNQSNTSVNRSDNNSFTRSLSNGNYNWTVQCIDEANNTANSSLFLFTISIPETADRKSVV